MASSLFVFTSPQEFANFVEPKDRNKQNDAQKELQKLLQSNLNRTAQSKKKRLGPDPETRWKELLITDRKNGYEDWWEDLKKKERPSKLDKYIILLVEAFGDKEWAWRFSLYPGIEQLSQQPHDFGKLLLFVMRQYRAKEGHTNQGHTSVNETRDDELGGEKQPLDLQPACERSANECGGVVSNVIGSVKRPNDGEDSSKKRPCLASRHREKYEVNRITSTENTIPASVSGNDHGPHITTILERSDIIEAPIRVKSYSATHKLIQNRQAQPLKGLSTYFQYYGQSDLDGTNDCVLEYLWMGYSACAFLIKKRLSVEKDQGVSYYEVPPDCIEELPYRDLVESMKRSQTWKMQSQGCEFSKCLTIRLVSLDAFNSEFTQGKEYSMLYASIKCIVAKEEAPEKRKLENVVDTNC